MNRFVRKILHYTKYFINLMIGNVKISILGKRRIENAPIKVGFIVQLPEVWDKESPVFEAMLSDARFDPCLIVVPAYDYSKSGIGSYGKELEYFTDLYPKFTVKAYNDNKWFSLREHRFDYIFYQRCYEHYLPYTYSTQSVIRFSRTCYIPYGIAGMSHSDPTYFHTSFFCNLFFFFCMTKQQEQHFTHRATRAVCAGVPALEETLYGKNGISVTESKISQILWTPRWTDDEYYGGSTFYSNMNNIITLKEKYPDVDVILRPHPLAFQNAVKTNRLSEKDVEEYKERVKNAGLFFDVNAKIGDTFENTDILITDYSSMIIQYFITGHPIIYCTNIDLDFDEIYEQIKDTFYVAKSWDEVMRIVDNLIHGIDPKKELRIHVLEKIKSENVSAIQNILEILSVSE